MLRQDKFRTLCSTASSPVICPLTMFATSSAQDRSLEGLRLCHHTSTQALAPAKTAAAGKRGPSAMPTSMAMLNAVHSTTRHHRITGARGVWNHSAAAVQAENAATGTSSRLNMG